VVVAGTELRHLAPRITLGCASAYAFTTTKQLHKKKNPQGLALRVIGTFPLKG
jgi:hypothetical protein